jgi:hypothetical protein
LEEYLIVYVSKKILWFILVVSANFFMVFFFFNQKNMVKCEKKIQLTFGISPDLFCLIKICHLYNAFDLLFSALIIRELVMDLLFSPSLIYL